MTDFKHLRELAEAALPDGSLGTYTFSGVERLRAFQNEARPQALIDLLDELKQLRSLRDQWQRVVSEPAFERAVDAEAQAYHDSACSYHRERDTLQARIDAALEYIDDPGNWGTYDGRRRLLHDLLSTPTENGEGDA